MPRQVPHEITLIAFTRDEETGGLSVTDIVPTSHRFAYRFTRRWLRMPEVVAIAAAPPGDDLGRTARIRHVDEGI